MKENERQSIENVFVFCGFVLWLLHLTCTLEDPNSNPYFSSFFQFAGLDKYLEAAG